MEKVLVPADRCEQRGLRDSDAATPSHRLLFVPILAVALLLRVVVAFETAKHGHNGWFFNQATELGCLAHSVLAGHGLASPFCGVTGPSAFLAPGYPLFVAAVFRLFGEETSQSATLIIGCQIVFGFLSVLTLMLLTRAVFGSRTANIAGTVCAVSPTMVCLPVLFWETSLSILFLTSALTFALHCVHRPKPRNWAAMGLLYAVAMLVNPALMLTLVAVLAWSTWMNRQAHKSKAAYNGPLLALTIWIVAFSVWPARNWFALHEFVPLRSNLGYELWQGNRSGSDGEFASTLHPNVNGVEYARYARLGEAAYMREKSSLARAAIAVDHARFVHLCARRFVQFWTGFSPQRNLGVVSVSLCLTTVLAASGLVLLARRRPAGALLLALPFLLFPLPYYVTHADFRFRLLLEPVTIMLSVYALQWLRHLVVRRSSQKAEAAATAIHSFI